MRGFWVWGMAMLMALAWPAAGAETSQRYDVYAGGLKIGTLGLDGRVSGSRYAASGRVAGGGLIGVFVTFDFSGTSQGAVQGGQLRPDVYEARSDDGKTARTTRMQYQGGRPVSVTFDPERKPRDYDAAASGQAGTLDPISATFALLAEAPAGAACGRSVEVYDGRRRSRLTVTPRRAGRDGTFVCDGTYTRVDGFSDKLMAERQTFPFTLIFRESAGVMQVIRFETQTTFGRVTAIRR
ncbi:MAG: DUF3108 domain-containing protein [Pseudomonadota bacterium]